MRKKYPKTLAGASIIGRVPGRRLIDPMRWADGLKFSG
jgi:hypothetical protein